MMTFREGKLEILLVLILQSAIWTLSTSLPENTAQLSPWSWDEDDKPWHRRSTTRKPYIWESSTTSRDDYKYKSKSSDVDTVMICIYVGGGILVIIISCVISCCCEKSKKSTNESSATLHPPPARYILPPNRVTQHSHIRTGSQNTRDSNIPSEGAQYNVGDEPPSYCEIPLFDFTEENTKFPSVSPKPLETPPPKYEDGNLPKY